MKRWFKLIGYAKAEGMLINHIEGAALVHLGQLESLMYSGKIPPYWPEPGRGYFLRETLPGGLSTHVFRCEPPLQSDGTVFYRQKELQRIEAPYPWDAVVKDWPS